VNYIGGDMRDLDFISFDLETTELKADFSVILSACIKPFGKDVIVFRADEYNPEWTTGDRKDDSAITAAILEELAQHAVIMVHYGSFDIRYINAKAVRYSLPTLPNIFVLDTYSLAKSNLQVSRRRLDALASYFFGETKHLVEGELWMKAGMNGDIEALDEIVAHNVQDVILLEMLARVLFPFVKSLRRV
jgi:DNA polymerase III epsilon subunit-like protein